MIRIKFEDEEQLEETPLPIESENENDWIKRLLSSKFLDNNLNNSTSVTTNNGNNNVSGILKPKPENNNNGMVPRKVVVTKKKTKQLDNFTTDSVAAFVGCSKSIKTEPVESSLSLTTQLNNSLNIQSLLRKNRIQNGWTTNEQSIPNSGETGTEMFSAAGPRAGFGRSTKLNVCYSVPMEPEVPRRTKPLPIAQLPPLSKAKYDNECLQFMTSHINSVAAAGNLELACDDNYNEQSSVFGSISDSGPSSSAVVVAAPSLPVPSLTSLEEKKARQSEYNRLRYLRQKANPEVIAEIRRRQREYNRNYRQKVLANATTEQREQRRLKQLERNRRNIEKETEEQRKRRLEGVRQYNRTVGKQKLANATPEQRELIRLKKLERKRRYREMETEEQRERRLEQMRQYYRTVGKNREMEQIGLNLKCGISEKERTRKKKKKKIIKKV